SVANSVDYKASCGGVADDVVLEEGDAAGDHAAAVDEEDNWPRFGLVSCGGAGGSELVKGKRRAVLGGEVDGRLLHRGVRRKSRGDEGHDAVVGCAELVDIF